MALGVASVQGVSALLFMTTALVLSVAGIFLVLQPLLEQEEKCDKDFSAGWADLEAPVFCNFSCWLSAFAGRNSALRRI